jgi:hypothetical protein
MRELNLSGMWNVVTFALRRWLTGDGVRPKVVAPAAVFVRNLPCSGRRQRGGSSNLGVTPFLRISSSQSAWMCGSWSSYSI